MSLEILQQMLEGEGSPHLRAYLDDLEQRTGNAAFNRAGAIFGFRTVLIEETGYALTRELTVKFHGRSDTPALTELLGRYGEKPLKISGFACKTQTLLRKGFFLSEHDTAASFMTYRHFLIAGLKGQTSAAHAIHEYLLAAEEQNRVTQGAQAETGLTPQQLARGGSLSPDILAMVQSITALSTITQGIAERAEQQTHMIRAMQSDIQTIAEGHITLRQDVDALRVERTFGTGYVTVKGYARVRKYRYTMLQAKAVSFRAKKVCESRGIEVGTVPDEQYGKLNSYPETILDEVWPMVVGE